MARAENGQLPLKRGEFRVTFSNAAKVLRIGIDGQASVDGRDFTYTWDRNSDGGGILRSGGKVFRVAPRGTLPKPGSSATIEINGIPVTCTVDDVRSELLRSVASSSAGQSTSMSVRAPMPGLVVKVEVKEGDRVVKGQGLVILEAMKMENELRAEGDGIVGAISVSERTPVEKGQQLMTIRNA